jgi:hypothetical protein
MPSIVNVTHGHFLFAAGLVVLVAVLMLAWRLVRRRRMRSRPARDADSSTE